MGIFSNIFRGSSVKPPADKSMKSIVDAKIGQKGGWTGGYGAVAFANIINAHSSAEEIALEFEMYAEGNPYSPEAWDEAFGYYWELAESEYEEMVAYFMSEIDILTGEMEEHQTKAERLEEEANQLEAQAGVLYEEAQLLLDIAESGEDVAEALDLIDEADALMDDTENLREEAEYEDQLATELMLNIEDLHSEMELLTVEEFLVDERTIELLALENATKYAQDYIDNSVWIPSEILDFAYYEVSDHNK